MKIKNMNLTPDRQGYLGDIVNKSIPQLKELLERQEKLLLKRIFLESLPDKGEKAKSFAIYLKQLIEQKSNDSTSSSALRNLSAELPKLGQTSDLVKNVRDHNNVDIITDNYRHDILITSKDISERTLPDVNSSTTPSNISHKDMLDSSDNITLSLEKMSLGSNNQTSPADTTNYINSYERVIKEKETTSLNQKPKFLPNRTLLDDHIPASPYAHDTRPKIVEREELSAVIFPCYKYQSSKLISLEESVELIEKQRAHNEELIAQRAARRLADQLIPKMDLYSPESTDMQYRETAETDQDSDDDDGVSQDEEY